MAGILALQTTFSSAFYWKKMSEIWWKFWQNVFMKVQLNHDMITLFEIKLAGTKPLPQPKLTKIYDVTTSEKQQRGNAWMKI